MNDSKDWMDLIVDAIKREPGLQTWKNHLDIRIPELIKVALIAGFKEKNRILEIGCGNGLGSAYFSKLVKEIVATDLAETNHSAHSIGLKKTRHLLRSLHVKNVELVGTSAEELPFPDKSFDAVFSIYVLEHLQNTLTGLKESFRVLRLGGKMITTVPTFFWSLFYPIAFYSDLGSRLFKHIYHRLKPKQELHSRERNKYKKIEQPGEIVKNWQSFKEAFPHFPAPEPHGESTSYWNELISLRTSN